MKIVNVLGQSSFWIVNKKIAKEVGIEAGLILSCLISWRNEFDKKDKLLEFKSFYKSQNRIEDETGLSFHKQRKAIKILKEKEFIDYKKMGMPAKNHFIINDDLLLNFLITEPKKEESDEKNKEPVIKNFNHINKERKKQKKETNISSKEDTTKVVKTFKIKKSKFNREEKIDFLEKMKKIVGLNAFSETSKWCWVYIGHLMNLGNIIGSDEFLERLKNILEDDFKSKNCNSLKYIYSQMKSYRTDSGMIKKSGNIGSLIGL